MLSRHVPHLACRRRELLLKSVNVGVLAALFNFGAVARPDGLGIQVRDHIQSTAWHMCGAMHLQRFPLHPSQLDYCGVLRLHKYFVLI